MTNKGKESARSTYLQGKVGVTGWRWRLRIADPQTLGDVLVVWMSRAGLIRKTPDGVTRHGRPGRPQHDQERSRPGRPQHDQERSRPGRPKIGRASWRERGKVCGGGE